MDILTKTDDVAEQLERLDLYCQLNGVKAELVMLGGAGLLVLMELLGNEFRPTRDVDVNILKATDLDLVRQSLYEADIHIVGGVMSLPPMEDIKDGKKYKLDMDFQAITVYVPSIELLACSKLFSKREKDLRDLRDSTLLDLCDITTLLSMVEEYKPYMLNPSDPDENVHQLEVILATKGIKAT